MSHKVHPKIFRIKETTDWLSRGFYDRNFKKLLSLEAYEFFYTEYVNSEDFKAAPSRRVLKKLSLNVK